MKKKIVSIMLCAAMVAALAAGCGNTSSEEASAEDPAVSAEPEEETPVDEAEVSAEPEADAEVFDETEVQLFAAASLSTVLEEIIATYNETQPNVTITVNADSSGTLLTQIEEGYECDIFFSAAQKQMNSLEEDGLIVEGTRANVLNNQLVVVTYKDSPTTVTGLENLGDAASLALCDGSVPAGKYTRQALINMGVLEGEEAADITTDQVSEALGGVEISEQANVSKALLAVAEQSCEVGTCYYSDTYGHEDEVDILEVVSYDLTGDIIYPICQVINEEADELQTAAAADFEQFILSDTVKEILQKYYFDTEVER